MGRYVLHIEVVETAKEMNKKAAGDDGVPGDVLKLLEEDDFEIMTQLSNSVYETGVWHNYSLKLQ
jgi:hypothetical protein